MGASGWLVAAVLGHRRAERQCLVTTLAQALTPLIGIGGPLSARTAVRARTWRGGWVGRPGMIRLQYAPAARSSNPDWLTAIVEMVGERVGVGYQVSEHDARRCRLTLVCDARPANSRSAAQVRAERVVRELLPGRLQMACTWDGEDLVSMKVAHQGSTRLAQAGYRARVERVVSAMLPGRWRATWDLQGDSVTFEVRPSFAESIWLPEPEFDLSGTDVLATYDQVALDYGVDEDGNVVWWRPAHDPNLMLCGAPGTGKTVCAHTLLARVTAAGWPAWVVDGKSIEFLGFRDWPNVQIVATTVAEQVAVIHRAHQVMEHRYELIVSGRAREEDFEPLMLFIDEWADFRGNLMEWYAGVKPKGGPAKPPVLGKVASLARKGRTSRVHLIFGTQRPDAEYFSGDMRDNFRMRISMGRLSPQGAMMMWESPIIGTTIPRGCRGRATTVNDHNRAVEIQTYRTPDPRKVRPDSSEEKLLDRLRPTSARHERLLILAPQVEHDLDTSEPVDPHYADFADAEWVLASSRPDLDPLARGTQDGEDRTLLSSPMTVVLREGAPRAAAREGTSGHQSRGAVGAIVTSSADKHPDEVADDVWDVPYGEEQVLDVDELQVGDLVLVDEAAGLWAVLAEEPDTETDDSDSTALFYRTDNDEDGVLVVEEGDAVTIRRSVDHLDHEHPADFSTNLAADPSLRDQERSPGTGESPRRGHLAVVQ